jgi:CrcB protein
MAFLGEYLAVASGGAVGAMLRYGATATLDGVLPRAFPWGTLAVNVLGSLLMGVVFVLLVERSLPDSHLRLFFGVGLLGAFTTFSAFSLDTLALIETGASAQAAVYVLASVTACLLAALTGILITRSF